MRQVNSAPENDMSYSSVIPPPADEAKVFRRESLPRFDVVHGELEYWPKDFCG